MCLGDGPVKAFGQEDLVGGEIGWHFPLHWGPRAGVSMPLLTQRLASGNSLENLVPKCLGLVVKWATRLKLFRYIEASVMQR